MNNKGNHQGYNNDNSWSGQNVRKSYDYYNQNNRGDYHQQQQHDGGNKIEQRMQNLRFDNGSSSGNNKANNADQQQHNNSKEPKKMTWATIASQPAKPQINTTSTTIKKKGPGGPPPPMIPGKHNMELNDGWDTPKNAPLVPPSPPIITAPPIDLSLDKQNSNFDGEPAWPTPGQAVSQVNKDQPTNNQNHPNSTQSQHNNSSSNNNKYDKYDKYENNNQRGYHHMNNNQNNNYHGRQQYSNNSNNNHHHHQNSGHPNNHHYNSQANYNDYQKPYHQHPHQMPTAPPQKYDQTPITRSMQQQQQPQQQPSQPSQQQQQPQHHQQNSSGASSMTAGTDYNKLNKSDENILEQLRVKNQYNPSELDLSLVDNARFFVIKSYSEDDIHRSIKYEIWCSTEHGNKRLDQAYREREKENGVIYLFFSVNSSGHFCGVAQMMTSVDYNSNSSVWSQDKWKGSFRVKWVYVKDVPNTQLRHIRLENNENKPVTNSRDTQEVPNLHGIQILKIIHSYKHTTSIFDDFTHYEKRQEEEDSRKTETNDGGYQKPMTLPASHHSTHNRENNNRQQYDREYNGGGGGFDRGNFNNGSSFNKYGSGYNNDFKPFNNGRGNYHNKRNDFRNNDRNDRNGSDQSGGIYRAKDYQQNDDFGNRGYRSDRGGSRGRGGFRSMNMN